MLALKESIKNLIPQVFILENLLPLSKLKKMSRKIHLGATLNKMTIKWETVCYQSKTVKNQKV